MIMLRMSYV